MSLPTLSTKLRRIAAQASDGQRVFTTLAHWIDVDLLRAAFGRLRSGAATGIDGETKAEYAEDLESNLLELHERLRSRRYRATPSRRAWVPKEGGQRRAISIPALEDKIVQRAVAMLLEPIYEQDFYEFSYGFRPKVGAHHALQALRDQIMDLKGVWLVDADIRGFYDHVPRGPLREIMQRRVNDGGLLRLIGKWLHAGIQEGDQVSHPETGVPQGGVISPLLSNIYLHTVLDAWFVEEVQPRLKGRSFLIRFADDFVIGCELEADARRVLAVLPKRLGRYGLSLHPEKTSLVKFKRPAWRAATSKACGNGTFVFLGLTHYWTRSRQGKWVVKRKTAAKRLRRAIVSTSRWCRRNLHRPFPEQYQRLQQKLRGHYAYYGIRGNYAQLKRYHQEVRRAWRKWLGRRSRASAISWKQFERLEKKFPLLRPRIVHNKVQLKLAGQRSYALKWYRDFSHRGTV